MAQVLSITEEIARSLLQHFFSFLDGSLQEFRANIEARNWSGVREIAHKIKGAAANLRIDGIASLCREAESLSQGNLTVDNIKVMNDIIGRIASLGDSLHAKVVMT